MEAHEDGIARFRHEAGNGGRPDHPNSHQQRGLRLSGPARFTTSAPELGVVDVFAEHAKEAQQSWVSLKLN
jgi:hypothetical protein